MLCESRYTSKTEYVNALCSNNHFTDFQFLKVLPMH